MQLDELGGSDQRRRARRPRGHAAARRSSTATSRGRRRRPTASSSSTCPTRATRTSPPDPGPEVQDRTRRPPATTSTRLQQADGAYAETPDPVHFVHSLEHGRVEIQYSPDLPEEDQLALKGVFDESPAGMLLFPNADMPYEVAVTAWTQLHRLHKYEGAATLDASATSATTTAARAPRTSRSTSGRMSACIRNESVRGLIRAAQAETIARPRIRARSRRRPRRAASTDYRHHPASASDFEQASAPPPRSARSWPRTDPVTRSERRRRNGQGTHELPLGGDRGPARFDLARARGRAAPCSRPRRRTAGADRRERVGRDRGRRPSTSAALMSFSMRRRGLRPAEPSTTSTCRRQARGLSAAPRRRQGPPEAEDGTGAASGARTAAGLAASREPTPSTARSRRP